MRAVVRLAAAVVVVIGVGVLPASQHVPATLKTSAQAKAAARLQQQKDQQAAYFFGGNLDDYGLRLSSGLRRKLLVTRAHRRINPCGLLDVTKLVAADPSFEQYGVDGDLSECDLKFRGQNSGVVAVKASQVTPTTREQERFTVNGVLVRRHLDPGVCLYVFDLGLAGLPGAPERLTDFTAQISADQEDGPEPCVRARAVATMAAAKAAGNGPPQWATGERTARVAEADPCLPVRTVPGVVGVSTSDTGTRWCGFLLRQQQVLGEQLALVKLNVRLRPAAMAQQQGDSWNVTETRTTGHGDHMLLVYNGVLDPATGSYRPAQEKSHCDVYLTVSGEFRPTSVDTSPIDDADARLPTVEVTGDQAPCETQQLIATEWAKQLS